MEKTPEKPDYVKSFVKPKNTEIKYIGGGWYLYEVRSVYDSALKRAKKISGRELGVITSGGLTQSKSEAKKNPPMPKDVVEVGATYYLTIPTFIMCALAFLNAIVAT